MNKVFFIIMIFLFLSLWGSGQVNIDEFARSYDSTNNEFINEVYFSKCRNIALRKNTNLFRENKDTIVFVEFFTDVNGDYSCGLYIKKTTVCYTADLVNTNPILNEDDLPKINTLIETIMNGGLNETLNLGEGKSYSPSRDLIITIFDGINTKSYIVRNANNAF